MSTENLSPDQVLNLAKRKEELKLDFAVNALDRRSRLIEKLMDPRRDVDDECGFPQVITEEMLVKMTSRNGIASKIISVFPDKTWATYPEVLENSDAEDETDFEKAFDNLHANLRIDNTPDDDEESVGLKRNSWFKDVESSPIWSVFKRADKMARKSLSGYSVIVLGFNDGEELYTPLIPKDGMELLYMTPYSEAHAKVASWNGDDTRKSFRRPKIYTVTNLEQTNDTFSETTMEVHHSRVLHICWNPEVSDLFCDSMLTALWNVLLGTDKIIGAAPEGYWKMAFTKLLLETLPGITEEDIDKASLKTEIFNYENSLQSVMALFGMKGQSIAPEVTDPSPFFEFLIEIASITYGIPKRILMGSERGELSSSQDKSEFVEVIMETQKNHCSPMFVAPFIDRLIWAGVLPEPAEGFFLKWPDLKAKGPGEQAEIAAKRAEAMSKFVLGGIGDSVMDISDFLTREMGYSQGDAKEIIDNFEPLPPAQPIDPSLMNPIPSGKVSPKKVDEKNLLDKKKPTSPPPPKKKGGK